MNRYRYNPFQFTLKLVVLTILLSSIGTQHMHGGLIDQTKIGVQPGDSFEYILVKLELFSSAEEVTEIDGYPLGLDKYSSDEVLIQEGEQFTITIIDTTIYQLFDAENGSFYNIKYEISYQNYIVPVSLDLDYGVEIVDKYITSTDWEGQRANLEDLIDSVTSDEVDKAEFEIIDTSSLFGLKFNMANTFDSKEVITTELQIWLEIKYFKETGMLAYQSVRTERVIADETLKSNLIIRAKESSTPSLSVPGMRFLTISLMFTMMVIIRKLNYKFSL